MFVRKINSFLSNVTTRLYKGDKNEKKLIKALTVCIIFSQLGGINAYATSGINLSDSKGSKTEVISELSSQEDPEGLEAALKKETLADIYMDFKIGNITEDELIKESTKLGLNLETKALIENNSQVSSKSFLESDTIIQDKLNNTGGVKASGFETYATSNILPGLIQTSQIAGHYCGPATASMIIDEVLNYTPGQDWLAQALGTNTSEGTPWRKYLTHPMRNVLNNYLNTSWYVAYDASTNDSSKLTNAVVLGIDSGYGIAANAYEPKGGSYRLKGHPADRAIEHWVAIDGYSNGGSTIHYAEPVYKAPSVSWYQNITNPYYNIPNYELSYIIWERGLIY
jgi:Peptidase_C39 like family